MAIEVFTAAEYRSAQLNRDSIAIFGPYGSGKTALLKTLPPDHTACVDIEAGLNTVRYWEGLRIKIANFRDFQDLVAMIAGPDLSAGPNEWFCREHFEAVRRQYAGSRVEQAAARLAIFVDSISDLTRLAFKHAKQQPGAFSERTNRPDLRSAYGILATEVILSLKHLQQARGKKIIFSGLLEKVTDDFGRVSWVPQMEGSKAGRELPGIVDQVCTLHYFDHDEAGAWAFNESAFERRLVCQSGNPWALPAKDRSGNLDLTEPPDLNALLTKINCK